MMLRIVNYRFCKILFVNSRSSKHKVLKPDLAYELKDKDFRFHIGEHGFAHESNLSFHI